MAQADDRARDAALPELQGLDELTAARGVLVSIGPVLSADRAEPHLPAWATELARTTKLMNLTVSVASPDRGTASVQTTPPHGLPRCRPPTPPRPPRCRDSRPDLWGPQDFESKGSGPSDDTAGVDPYGENLADEAI